MSGTGKSAFNVEIEVATSVVTHAGTRADIEFLNEGGEQSELASGIIADTRFTACRRTLR